MNGDMPHVPITTLAGIASLTDLLNQLPLPSPLPATTAKSLLYNGRISEEVSSLLVCRDENLVTQLAHSLNQVSTEHIELKDNLGNDEPEGDMPMLLQTLLSRNPKIFRDKSMPTHCVMQQPLMQQYKISQNQVHGSPASNYQQTTVPQSPSGCFASRQSGSAPRFVQQQNSPIPSPYTPQSPADYMQYNPPNYSQHQQTQQVAGGVRNSLDNKVSGQLSSKSSNHNARLGSNEEYLNMAHRLRNEENEPSMRVVAFPVKSPESVCSPAGSEETIEKSRLPLIRQSPPASVPPGASPDIPLTPADHKKKQRENELMDQNALYDIVSSPSKDSARLTLKLSRVKIPDMDQSGELVPRAHLDLDHEANLMNHNQLSKDTQDLSQKFVAEEQANYQQVPVRPSINQTGVISGVVYEDADSLVEMDRIERDSASERERSSKEVQDKDKPLKKRKQDSYPQECGAEASDWPAKTSAASNGASRPALMVSIDLQQAGRVIGQPVVVLEGRNMCEDHSKVHTNLDKVVENKHGINKQRADYPRKSGSDEHQETPKQKQEGRRDSKHKHESKMDSGKGHSDDRRTETPRQKHDKHSESRHKEEKNHNSHRSHVNQTETPKTMSKAERIARHAEDKAKDREKDKDRDRDRDRDRDISRDREKKHKTLSRESCNRHSPDRHTKSDSARLKQDGSRKSTDLNGRQRTDGYPLQYPQNKKERKDGDGSIRYQGVNKQQSSQTSEAKPSEFPSYLLGGTTGSLKNFVIPKLKRDVKDKDPQVSSKLVQGWSEPLVRLERVSLVENLNKGAKPVVVLQKLSVDEVKRIIKESKNTNRSRYGNWSFDKSERGMIFLFLFQTNCCLVYYGLHFKKSKHAEIDSDEDDDSDSKSVMVFSFSAVARRLKKKEKQKNRKSYDPKLTPEEMMDSSSFKRFTANIDNILDNLDDADLTATADDDDIPQELLLGKHQLSELGSDSAKIKSMGVFNKVRDVYVLPSFIWKTEERLWRDLIMERVTKSADACLTALNIMTSPHMPKAVYIEDVIERVLQYTKFHLQNSIYPQYDSAYRVDTHGGGGHTSKSKKAKCSAHKQKVIVTLYNKVCDIVSKISELLEIQLLTDNTILQVSTLGITPFFVENVSELQLCAITLVTAVFSRYEKHRQLILEEIFTSLAKLPTNKRSLRNFRLNSGDSDGEPVYIQMVTALVLQLIQCVINLTTERHTEDEHNKRVDKDVLITNSYETAMRTAQNFLSVFLKKCGSKQGEDDYRPLFENFVHDLLSTINKPEWPGAELLLSLLGRLLVHQFSNKQTEMALRVASLDYLGTVASRLRKDAVTSKMDQKAIDRILRETPGNDEIQQLQKELLSYLDEKSDTDPSLVFARKFYIAQWFRDTTSEAEKAIKSQNENDEDAKGLCYFNNVDSTEEIMQRAEARKKFLRKVIEISPSHSSFLRTNTVDYEDSCLIVRYLASMRPFAQSFDIYLSQILRVLGESAIAVRTKAMKCLSEVVAVDPSILARLDMQRGVHCRLMDNSTSVREAAVELLGRFVLSRPELIEQYYDMLIERILDTGISVRKRVIKILRDICLEQPDFHKITEMCVKMIRRVNDEEGIKKLVNETFQKLWFTPTPSHDKNAMTRKILNITDVVSACKDSGYDWFEQLLQNLLKSEQDASYKPAKKACVQLVDNLVEHILKYEESLADCEDKGVISGRLVACITTLYLFSKIRAQLMVKHAMTMQPYLTTKCNTQNDFMVICNVAKILELVVPLMEHPSETFLTTIEEDLMKLIIKYGMTVVQHCVSCLGAIVNKVTHNYKFVWACFNRYYGALAKLKTQHQEDPNSSTLVANKPTLLRSLFTVGALCRHFDFDQEEFKGASKIVIKDKVLELLLYFTTHEDEEVQIKAIIGLGFQFIMHPELMFVQDVKVLYNNTLSDENSLIGLKIQVLKNLQTYLQEEDSRMQEADREWKKQAKQEDLKEMGDISSGMSSSIMQIYLKQVLESFLNSQSTVRHFALSVITLTLNQGLIHPVQCVPYLIAMGTDPEPTMKNKADQQLVEIDKKYSGFIHMKAVAGLKMSYQVQQAIKGSKDTVIRGFRHDDSDSALCSHLYTMVRGNRQHRRAFLISLLNLFDDSSKTEVNMLLFIADNLACFPYQSQEEPLFIMHHIDITLSVSGSNLLQSFKESLRKEPSSSSSSSSEEDNEVVDRQKKSVVSDCDSDMDDEDAVMGRLPENPDPLLDFASASQGILLLLVLKQHLKNLFGFSDSKIQKYSPTESAKVYDKAVNRKSKVHFDPRQTLNYVKRDMGNTDLSSETKRNIVKQYLDFKVLMEHLDRDEEDEEGEASANAKNKAITSLLRGPKPQNHNHNNHAALETDDDESEDEDPPAVRLYNSLNVRCRDSVEDSGHMNEKVEAMDVIAICCPKYKDRPQIARVIQKTKSGYSIHWMTGSYSGPWVVAKKRDGRKKVPWVDTIKESDIIYKKISLTSGHKLTNKVAQTLRALYAAREGT
uniref:Nipped-B protein n=1 Tax=Echeneis naucrates TaxID=173247 RepID=A0A665VUX1_ECHNA